MPRILIPVLLVTCTALGYALAQAAGPVISSAREAAVTTTQASLVQLDAGDAVIGGAPDGADGAWVLTRTSDDRVAAYHLTDATRYRVPLPIPAAGRLGAISAEGGVVWAGANDRLVAFDAVTGATLRTVTLPAVQKVATRAQRAPDGAALGLGQVTALAATRTGVWVGRYAASEIAFLDSTGTVSVLPLAQDVDVKAFTRDVLGTVWFTTNVGPSDQLGAFVGRITGASVALTPIVAASLASGPQAIHVLARDWRELDAGARITATHALPPQTDASVGAMTATGDLVIRGAKQAALHVYDTSGVERHRIDYATGSFIGRGGISYAATARLQFLFAAPTTGAIWFAPEGSEFVYRAT